MDGAGIDAVSPPIDATRSKMLKRPLILFPVVLVAAAIFMVLYGTFRVPHESFVGNLRDLLPPPPNGWQMREKPIADTPEMKKAVDEILNFDDGVFVDYTGPDAERVSVYMAHWRPGKMSHRLVAVHTPDVCWVSNGWQKTVSSRLPPFSISSVSSAGNARTTTPSIKVPAGQDRAFLVNQNTEYVWFWHLVGDESLNYDTGFAPPWYASLADLFRKGFNQREEQFFIRISSPRPLEPQKQGPVLGELLARVPWPQATGLNSSN